MLYRFHAEYRKKVLYGKLRNDIRGIITILCKYKNVEIIDRTVCTDHIHLSIAISLKNSISSFMRYLKGKSARMVYDKYPELQSKQDISIIRGEILCMKNRQYNGRCDKEIYPRHHLCIIIENGMFTYYNIIGFLYVMVKQLSYNI